MGKGRRKQQRGNQGPAKKQRQEVEDGHGTLDHNKPKRSTGQVPITGLSNLGNTCFFNSVMQNLAQTHYLRQRMAYLLAEKDRSADIPAPRKNMSPLRVTVSSEPGKFVEDFYTFAGNMRSISRGTMNPRIVFNHVCKNAPRFNSYQQQDSHELLRYLLDALRSEEITRIKRGILEAYGVKGKEGKDPKSLAEEDKKSIKAYGLQATAMETYIDEIFGGKIASTITCRNCDSKSELQEGFLDLSLPIPVEKSFSFMEYLGFKSKRATNTAPVPSSDDDVSVEQRGRGGRQRQEEQRLSKHKMKQLNKQQRKKSNRAPKLTLSELEQRASKGETSLSVSAQRQSPSPVYSGMARLSIDDSNVADDEDGTPLSTGKDEYPSIIPVTSPTTPPALSNENISESIIQLHRGGENVAAGEPSVMSTPSFAVGTEESNETRTRQREVSITEINEPLENIDEDNEQSLGPNSVQLVCAVGDTGEAELEKRGNGSLVTEVDCPLENLSETMSPVSSSTSMKVVNSSSVLAPSTINTDSPTDPPIEEDPPTDPPIEEGPSTDPHIEDDPPLLEGDPPTNSPIVDAPPSEDDAESSLSKTPVRKAPLHVVQSNNAECTLQQCLSDFVSQETLKGNDKFLCEVCTENAKKEKLKNSSHNSTPAQAVPMCDKIDKASCSTIEACNSDHAHNISKLQTVHEGGKDDVSSLSSSTGEDDEDTEMVESTKESDDIEDSPGDDSSSERGADKANVVYTEAMKQLLIDTPPIILCLHLKRFMQQGRYVSRVKKNNLYVSFPTILDMAPYCTDNCEDLFDSYGSLLYSLYGVVVHGGGMHGGHYTAFVRVRRELSLDDICSCVGGKVRNEETPVGTDGTNSTSRPSRPGEEVDQATVTFRNSVNECDSEVGTPAPDPDQPAPDPNQLAPDPDQNNTTPIHKHPSDDREFDLSSTMDDQWYYISDSHVRKSSLSEVLECQAYILFYERLPFQKR